MPYTTGHDDGDPHAIELEQEPAPREVTLTYRGPGPVQKRRLRVVRARPGASKPSRASPPASRP